MALIILSRPFPGGISIRITYVRVGSHLLHGGDALEALDAMHAVQVHCTNPSWDRSLAFALACTRARARGRLRETRGAREGEAALRDGADEKKVLDWLPPKVRSG